MGGGGGGRGEKGGGEKSECAGASGGDFTCMQDCKVSTIFFCLPLAENIHKL